MKVIKILVVITILVSLLNNSLCSSSKIKKYDNLRSKMHKETNEIINELDKKFSQEMNSGYNGLQEIKNDYEGKVKGWIGIYDPLNTASNNDYLKMMDTKSTWDLNSEGLVFEGNLNFAKENPMFWGIFIKKDENKFYIPFKSIQSCKSSFDSSVDLQLYKQELKVKYVHGMKKKSAVISFVNFKDIFGAEYLSEENQKKFCFNIRKRMSDSH